MQPTRPTERPSHSPGTLGVIRLGGVPIRVHFTFVLLFAFLLVFGFESQSGAAIAGYIAALFASVLLHELGHALVAKRYGIRTLEIVMYPIGGVARVERSPKAREEFWIAIAGPAVNLAIAGALFGVLLAQGTWQPIEGLGKATDANLLQRIAVGNLVLAMFNLLPAFPMDGGRILRSLVALKVGEDEATRIASRAGQYLAVAIGLYGLISMQFMLVFVAFFVYLGAAQEGWMARGRILIAGAKARDAMLTDFKTLSHGDTIREAAEMLLATSQQDFPVLHGEQVVGLLSRSALMRTLASEGPDGYVAAAMDREPLIFEPGADLSVALAKLTPAAAALVMEDGRLVGMLTTENLSELLVLRSMGLSRKR